MSKAYENAGVNINAGYEAVERISSHVERTMRKEVFGGLGGFGATFDLSQLNMTVPLLVSGTDGVGTKLKLAIDNNKHDTIGIDVVAMCVNDILTTGAEPLYFLDYIAANKVVPEVIEQIVKGVSDGCEQTNTALIGGETAEMGDMYHEGDYDLAGFAVGAVEKDAYIDGSQVEAGHVLVGLSSSGIHSNGYSLVRKIIANSGVNLNDNFDEDRTYLQTFLEPTRLYVKPVLDILNQFKVYAMTHITGGGFYENIPRALPEGVTAQIDATAYEVPKIFKWLQQHGDVPADEMYNVFNMGIGYTLVVDKENSDAIIKIAQQYDTDASVIGEIVEGDEPIQITGVSN